MCNIKYLIIFILCLSLTSCSLFNKKSTEANEGTNKIYEVKGFTKYTKIAKNVEKDILANNKNADKSTIRYAQYKAIKADKDCDLSTDEIQKILDTLK